MKEIIIYTDGGCRMQNNKVEGSPSAWAYTLTYGEHYKEDKKAYYGKTNNQMEMMAIIESLKSINDKTIPVRIHSDSAYCINGITSWVKGWKLKGWKNSKKETVENKELWVEMDKLVSDFEDIKFIKVKGHSGDYGNERVDTLVNLAMDELISNKNINEQNENFIKDYNSEINEIKQLKKQNTNEENNKNTDLDKFKKLLTEIGCEFSQYSNRIIIDDGYKFSEEEICIEFCKNGKFKAFSSY